MLDDIEPALKATSNRIRELREDQGLSIQAMAIKAGVDPKQLKKIENGETITSALWLSRFMRNFDKDLCDFYDERFIELYRRHHYKPFVSKLSENLSAHCCRHTFISLMVEADIKPLFIKLIVGHAGALSLTEKVYTHIDIETLLEAVNKI